MERRFLCIAAPQQLAPPQIKAKTQNGARGFGFLPQHVDFPIPEILCNNSAQQLLALTIFKFISGGYGRTNRLALADGDSVVYKTG